MIELSHTDRSALNKLLTECSLLRTERGREAALETAGLQDILPLVDLSGPSAIALPLLLNAIVRFGDLSYGQPAVGAFLTTVRDYVGSGQRATLDGLIAKYDLGIPTSNVPLSSEWPTTPSDTDTLEKIIGENTLHPVAFLHQAIECANSVAYVEVSSNGKKWSGTGFMVARNLLLTNHHVLPNKELASRSTFRFNYQLDSNGNPLIAEDFVAAKNGLFYTHVELDYTVVELDGQPADNWGYLVLSRRIPELTDRVYIVQHPNGLPKQITMQNNFVKFANNLKIQYVTSTLPGSSGSPVFDGTWTVIGLHHAGGSLPEEDLSRLYFRNEAIACDAIVDSCPTEVRTQLKIR